jgi:2-dehydro-3-deoxyphosphogluconate aldolase/(4S)-4-hydroxy-2-oxoglutarate aldolase
MNLTPTSGLLAILRSDKPLRDVTAVARALADAGFTAVEVTLTTPEALVAIAALAASGILPTGAGSVLDRTGAEAARAAGATFLVTPVVARDVLDAGLPVIMGAFTPTEAWQAQRAGAAAVKLFPAHTLGADYLRALRAPLPHLRVMPTGGITPANIGDWRRAGAVGAGIGSELRVHELHELGARATAFVNAWRAAA